ncbi:type II secretion system protein GspD [Pseudorhodoferax aquiterrae]|uniref:Type II secretion system protein GspD n=1 Tax=Pseudorhodoferax aquiterrae TaxID=747304 RepID=A0ABQ3G204_9BURK|nr:type II secretion system secretin GspD [Pseudorhodoferax aquiterrae]GHC84257.1 type II secretion system protein GspD [Pseudorhodoferax aquiterrae]
MTVPRIACGSLAFVVLSASAQTGTGLGGTQDAEPTTASRILRGNDRVVAAPRSLPALTGGPVSLHFEEAPVADVVRTVLGDILKVDYTLHPPIDGAVTLSTRKPVSPDQAVFLLESALQANGLALMRDARGSFQVGPAEVLRALGVSVSQAGGKDPLPAGYGAVIVPLEFIGANEMAAILRPLLQPESLVRVDPLRNLLVLVGSRSQAEAWMELVRSFDVDLLQGMSVGLFSLKYATVADVAQGLELLNPAAAAVGGAAAAPGAARPAPAMPATGGADAALAASRAFHGMHVMPIERLNAVLVVAPRASQLDQARRWIERLDQPNESSTEPRLFIYHVQNGNARHLASLLAGLFGEGGQGSAPPSASANSGVAPGLPTATVGSRGAVGGTAGLSGSAGGLTGGWSPGGLNGTSGTAGPMGTAMPQGGVGQTQTSTASNVGKLRVMADDVNNVVLIWGPRSEYAKIEASLKRLDVPPNQVLIEASIIEVTLDDSLQYGLQWFFRDGRRNGLYGSGGLFNAASAEAGRLTGATSQGFTYTLRAGGLGGDIRVVLNALASKSLLKVISSPSLMVQDNFTANIAAGTQQPVNAGTTISGSANLVTTNIQYKDTGVNLSVTPSVNAGNMVNMLINQSVTDLGSLDDATQQYSFLQRQISTKVAVRSGETLVLGGLIRDNSSNGRSGLPVLQDIPVVGKLFGSTTKVAARTELLLTITPRVVRSDQELRDVSNDLRLKMQGLSSMAPATTAAPAEVIVEPLR